MQSTLPLSYSMVISVTLLCFSLLQSKLWPQSMAFFVNGIWICKVHICIIVGMNSEVKGCEESVLQNLLFYEIACETSSLLNFPSPEIKICALNGLTLGWFCNVVTVLKQKKSIFCRLFVNLHEIRLYLSCINQSVIHSNCCLLEGSEQWNW